jgi:hypothetical protein
VRCKDEKYKGEGGPISAEAGIVKHERNQKIRNRNTEAWEKKTDQKVSKLKLDVSGRRAKLPNENQQTKSQIRIDVEREEGMQRPILNLNTVRAVDRLLDQKRGECHEEEGDTSACSETVEEVARKWRRREDMREGEKPNKH